MHLSANNPRHGQPLHRADRRKEQHELSTEKDHEQDDKNREGQRKDDVDDAHHQRVHFAAQKTGDGAVKNSDRESHRSGAQADRDGDLASIKNSHQEIAAERVGPEPVAGAWAGGAEPKVLGLVRIFQDGRAEE